MNGLDFGFIRNTRKKQNKMRDQFKSIAQYYSDIYFKEDIYEKESKVILSLIKKYKQSDGNYLLDVACGTGTHVNFFSKKYKVYGLDYSKEMLMIARRNYPNVKFLHRNMVDFHLKLTFDVILCLYGSIGFVQTVKNLNRTLKNLSSHLNPSGILVLVPWSNTEDFKEKIVTDIIKKPNIKIVRMENVRKSGSNKLKITYNYLIGKNKKVQHLTGEFNAGLFSKQQYRKSIQKAGLKIVKIFQGKDIQMGMAYICTK